MSQVACEKRLVSVLILSSITSYSSIFSDSHLIKYSEGFPFPLFLVHVCNTFYVCLLMSSLVSIYRAKKSDNSFDFSPEKKIKV